MTFKPDENILEHVWKNLPKEPDEDHITFVAADIDEIWLNGFVDTEACPLEDWAKLFEPHKMPDGTFVLTKEEFLEKDKYRYTGEIMLPFEPFLINEGKYTDEGLQELIDQSITPSCSKNRHEIGEFFKEFKKKYRESDDLITINMAGKREIARFISDNPSPTRRRELLFDALFIEALTEQYGEDAIFGVKATPEQASSVQLSAFSTLPSSKSEKAASELKSILKSKKPKAAGTGDEGIEMKKIKRSRKGLKG